MWSVLQKSPLRAVLTLGYLAFVVVYLITGFLPARASAESSSERITGHLHIPAADLSETVVESSLSREGQFYVSDYLVSVYQKTHKKFLMGHSHTAFQNLPQVEIDDTIFYEGRRYHVISKVYQKVADIKMAEIIADTERDTLVLMTCAGENNSERLIITAE